MNSRDMIPTQQQWEDAVRSKNIGQIKSILQQEFIPTDINTKLLIHDYSDQHLTPIEILLRNNHLGQDAKNFDIADSLLKNGAHLPDEMYGEQSKKIKLAIYFSQLVNDSTGLYIALRKHPELITQQDENGQTLLHHAAKIGLIMGSNSASLIHYLLFNAPGANLSIQDKDGNTPVHIAALYCEDRVTCQYVFPNYVKHAHEQQFDFSKLNQQGQSVLHIASRISYTDPRGLFPRINNVANVLKNAPGINVNTLSSSGLTALYYALNWLHLSEAKSLVTAGADPHCFGDPDRDPIKMLDTQLAFAAQLLSQDCAIHHHGRGKEVAHFKQLIDANDERLFNIIAKLQGLKDRMLKPNIISFDAKRSQPACVTFGEAKNKTEKQHDQPQRQFKH